jgi:hypothetical protein
MPKSTRTAWRGAAANDPEVRSIGAQSRERHISRILEAIGGRAKTPTLLRLAVAAWVAFAQEAIAEWLEKRVSTREALVALLASTLERAIAAAREIEDANAGAGPSLN